MKRTIIKTFVLISCLERIVASRQDISLNSTAIVKNDIIRQNIHQKRKAAASASGKNLCPYGEPQFCQWESYGGTVPGETVDGEFGKSTSLSFDGERLAVGGLEQSFVYDYNAEDNLWVLNFDFSDSLSDGAGFINVALSNDGLVLALGAPNNDEVDFDLGRVRVYENDGASSDWTQRGGDLDGENAKDYFGVSLDISDDGSILCVGAIGFVNLYEYTPGGDYELKTPTLGVAADGFGKSASISGDGSVLIIGAPDFDNFRGYIRIIDIANGLFVQTINGDNEGDTFGSSTTISLDGNLAGAGAPEGHYARFYRLNVDTLTWKQEGLTLTADEGGTEDASGLSLSASADGTRVIVGQPYTDIEGALTGKVASYEKIGLSWSKVGFDPTGDYVGGLFGYTAEISPSGYKLLVSCTFCAQKGEVNVYTLYDTRSFAPTLMPSSVPTKVPSLLPSIVPSEQPQGAPSIMPTFRPTLKPSLVPSFLPTHKPTGGPTSNPTKSPTAKPTPKPTDSPTEGVQEAAEVAPAPAVVWPLLLLQTLLATTFGALISAASVAGATMAFYGYSGFAALSCCPAFSCFGDCCYYCCYFCPDYWSCGYCCTACCYYCPDCWSCGYCCGDWFWQNPEGAGEIAEAGAEAAAGEGIEELALAEIDLTDGALEGTIA